MYIISLFILFVTLLFIFSIQSSDLTRVVYLIFLYLFAGILLTFFDLYYIGLTYIIVYVGAIAILFLFILMIIQNDISIKNNKNYLSLILILTYFYLPSLTPYIHFNYYTNWLKFHYNLIDIHNITILLLGPYKLNLLLLGIILWVILIGIIHEGVNKKKWYMEIIQ